MKKVYLMFLTPLFLYSQNLEELVNLSINNKMVNASQQSLDSVKDAYESSKSGYLPKVDVGSKYSITNQEQPTNPEKSTTAYGSVSYTLYDGGKKYDVYDAYESTIKSGTESLESLKNNISLNVITYYFNYLSLVSQKDAKLKEIEQLETQLKRLNRFLDVGTTTEDEVQKLISSVENSKVTLQELELQIETILHNLEYVTGESVTITTGSNIKELENGLNSDLRFDIKSLEYDLQTKRSNAEAEKSGYLPTIVLNNTYTTYNMDYENNSYKYPYDSQNVVSATLSWNVFSFGETKYKHESKFKDYLSSKSKLEYEKNKASVDLKLALKAYEIGKAKIKSAQANLKAASSAYDVIKSKFENGLVDNVAYLQSLSEKYNAISQLNTSINDLEIKKANIIYQSGKKLQEYIK